jgi:hypothetical protein
MNRRKAISIIGFSAILPITNTSIAQATISIADLAWCFWHEGERLYDDSIPGHIRDVTSIRIQALSLQAPNPGVENALNFKRRIAGFTTEN